MATRWPGRQPLTQSGSEADGFELLEKRTAKLMFSRPIRPVSHARSVAWSPDFDIYRPANLLSQPHGADHAKLFAAERADRLLAKADLERIAAPGVGFAGT
jgi:hypothetical protein